jgi:hypothetical protein
MKTWSLLMSRTANFGRETVVRSKSRSRKRLKKSASFMASVQIRRSPERHLGRSPDQTF